jgi:hypothetical protein
MPLNVIHNVVFNAVNVCFAHFFIYSPLITPLHAVTEQLGITKRKTKQSSSNKAGVCMQLASSEQGERTRFESNAKKGRRARTKMQRKQTPHL